MAVDHRYYKKWSELNDKQKQRSGSKAEHQKAREKAGLRGVSGGYDKWKASQGGGGGGSNTTSTGHKSSPDYGRVDGGMYNMNGIMESIYGWEPDEDDDAGRAFKNTMAGNMLMTGFNASIASAMGQEQAAIAKDQMALQSKLETQYRDSGMAQEYKYGSAMMGQQFELQNSFANAQHSRDINMVGAQGADYRKSLKESGNQDRLSRITQGEQDRLNIGAQGAVDQANIKTQGAETRLNIGAQGEQDRLNIGAQGKETRLNIGAQGEQDRLNITAQGDQDVRKMEKGDELTARRAGRQQARARSLARSF